MPSLTLPELRFVAVVETSSSAERVRSIVDANGRGRSCSVHQQSVLAASRHRLEIRSAAVNAAFGAADIAAALRALLNAADTGLLERFRIVRGYDLLRGDPTAPLLRKTTASGPGFARESEGGLHASP